MSGKRVNWEERRKERYDWEEYEWLEPYKNSHIRIKYRHICGHEGYMAPGQYLYSGVKCYSCAQKESGLKRRKRSYPFMHEVREDYREKMMNGETTIYSKIPFICKKHGEYWQRINDHASGCGCPECYREVQGKQAIRSDYDFINEVVHEDVRESIRRGEIRNDRHIEFMCPIHGIYRSTLTRRRVRGGCPRCGIEARGKAQRRIDYEFMDEIREDYRERVKNAEFRGEDKIPFICKEHGEYWQALDQHSSGKGCKICAMGVSPIYFRNWLMELTHERMTVNDRQQIKPLEIDFYYPKLKLGFEFNDAFTHATRLFQVEDFRNPSWNKGKSSEYHLNKSRKARAKNIRLIHVWDTEWSNERQRPILESIIKHAMGLTERRIYGRKCKVLPIDEITANCFFHDNDIMGEKHTERYIGLFYEEELVGVTAFGPGKGKRIQVERLSFLKDTVIIGGMSKLHKAIWEVAGYRKIDMWTFTDYFSGKSMEQLGMTNTIEFTCDRYL